MLHSTASGLFYSLYPAELSLFKSYKIQNIPLRIIQLNQSSIP